MTRSVCIKSIFLIASFFFTCSRIDKSISPLKMIIMDPLAAPLACPCVPGYAQRDYDKTALYMEKYIHRRIKLVYSESLISDPIKSAGQIDVIIGKYSTVVSDAKKRGLNLKPVALLSDLEGNVTLHGLFITRKDDSAKSLEDIAGYRMVFGPEHEYEKHSAAFLALEVFGIPLPDELKIVETCNSAAIGVVENDYDAGVISSYALPLLKGCGTVDKDSLKVIGRTGEIPFICVFITDSIDREQEGRLIYALKKINRKKKMLKILESKEGFIEYSTLNFSATNKGYGEWTDWRGPGRSAFSPYVPDKLPDKARKLWEHVLTGPGMAGVAVTAKYVVIADKSVDDKNDIFRCFNADTGKEIWKISYSAIGELDFSNSPRATPVIYDGRVYLLGAFGHLHCVELETGNILWKKNLMSDFWGVQPSWGFCSTPLIVDDKLIINPGGKYGSLVALNRKNGDVIWKKSGDPSAYSSFLCEEFGGKKQIVGFDSVSLGGWDPNSGERLWRIDPEYEGDFNVPTPVKVDDKLLVTTENNGTILYGFDKEGKVQADPVAYNTDLAPDTSSPVYCNGLIIGSFEKLYCFDINNDLKTLWSFDEKFYLDYCTYIAGKDKVLIISLTGTISLIEANSKKYTLISRLELFKDEPDHDRDIWGHPVLIGDRLYVRNLMGISCFLLKN